MSSAFRTLLELAFTNDQFWGDEGAGVLIICPKTKRILMQLRGEFVNEPNTWGVIGGAISGIPGESSNNPMAGAEKEVREELGYTGSLKLFRAYKYVSPKGNFKYHNFIGLVPEEFELNPSEEHKWETGFIQWMTFKEMMKQKNNFHFGLKALLNDPKSLSIIKKYTL